MTAFKYKNGDKWEKVSLGGGPGIGGIYCTLYGSTYEYPPPAEIFGGTWGQYTTFPGSYGASLGFIFCSAYSSSDAPGKTKYLYVADTNNTNDHYNVQAMHIYYRIS